MNLCPDYFWKDVHDIDAQVCSRGQTQALLTPSVALTSQARSGCSARFLQSRHNSEATGQKGERNNYLLSAQMNRFAAPLPSSTRILRVLSSCLITSVFYPSFHLLFGIYLDSINCQNQDGSDFILPASKGCASCLEWNLQLRSRMFLPRNSVDALGGTSKAREHKSYWVKLEEPEAARGLGTQALHRPVT